MPDQLDEFFWNEVAKMLQDHTFHRGDTRQIQLTGGKCAEAKVIVIDGDEFITIKFSNKPFGYDGFSSIAFRREDPLSCLPSEIKACIPKNVLA